MLSIPGTEALSPAVKYVIAFAIIFLLLALFALVLRRLTGGRLSLPSGERGRSRQPRLGIVDVYDLDRQRQLILLRRDNVEHLLLIGGPNDVIVETNIVRTPGARLPPPPPEQAADRPESFERAFETHGRPLIEPQRPEPVVARLGATDARAEQRNGPVATAEPVLKPDVVALPPAPPAPPPRQQPMREPAMREHPPLHAVREPPQPMREPPPAREPPPQPPAPRVAPVRQAPPPREPAPQPQPEPLLRAVPEPPRQPAPPPAPAPVRQDATGADAAVLSNMAKQLEEALKRPLSTGKPLPGAAAHPNGPAQQVEDRPARGAPAPSSRPPQPVPPPPPTPVAAAKPPEPAERPRPMPAPVARMRPAPEPEPPPPPPPEPARPAPEDQQSDPFSVEEIEAEFARLLGRPLDRGERPH